jgi:hypothetical protein
MNIITIGKGNVPKSYYFHVMYWNMYWYNLHVLQARNES